MEPTQIQLALNVVTITGITSLAGYCYLLKKENRRLATGAQAARTQKEAPKTEVVQTVVHLPSTSTVAAAVKPAAAVEIDIRTLASARRARWVKNLASSVS
jgi:hypothetical protein